MHMPSKFVISRCRSTTRPYPIHRNAPNIEYQNRRRKCRDGLNSSGPDSRSTIRSRSASITAPRPELQRLPGLRRHDDGRSRRHREQDRSGQPLDKDIYGLLPRGAQGHPERGRQPRRSPCSASARTTTSCSRATSSPRTSSTCGSAYKTEADRQGCACARRRWEFACITIAKDAKCEVREQTRSPRETGASCLVQYIYLVFIALPAPGTVDGSRLERVWVTIP